MRCKTGQRALAVLASWVCFVILAHNLQSVSAGYRSGRFRCCTGCTSCSCASRGGSYGTAAPGTICSACASGPGQQFLLQGSSCGELLRVASVTFMLCVSASATCKDPLDRINGFKVKEYVRSPEPRRSMLTDHAMLRLLHCTQQFTLLLSRHSAVLLLASNSAGCMYTIPPCF
jgi:hypothetical protein